MHSVRDWRTTVFVTNTQQITYTLFDAVTKATETTQERLLQNNEYFSKINYVEFIKTEDTK